MPVRQVGTFVVEALGLGGAYAFAGNVRRNNPSHSRRTVVIAVLASSVSFLFTVVGALAL